MLTSPIYPCMASHVERRLQAATEPSDHWKVPDPYRAAIQAERNSSQISYAGFTPPGLLRVEDYMLATNWALQDGNLAKGEHQVELVLARQQMVDMRQAMGELSLRVILSTAALSTVFKEVYTQATIYPDRNQERHAANTTSAQAKRLLLAYENGWDLKMVPDGDMREALGSEVLYSILCEGASGQPPGVYMEVPPSQPGGEHELWENASEVVEGQAAMHEWLASRAIPADDMLEFISARVHPYV